jgi:tetratricopeptide (TPR) repeat protein
MGWGAARLVHSRGSALSPGEDSSAAYAGSVSCRDCHQEEYRLWAHSHHALAERAISPEIDRAAFSPNRSLGQGNQAAEMFWSNGAPRVSCAGAAGKLGTFELQRVLGEEPLRQFLVAFPGGRYQVLDRAYDPRSNQWFSVFGNEERQPGEWGHWTGRGLNWNSMCASCHNTAVARNYDPASDSYRTTMAEQGVGCEACHGPLKAHNLWQQRSGHTGKKDPTLPALSKRQMVDNCGYCHSRRAELAGGFRPGEDYSDHCDLVIVDHTGRYYGDGQVHEEDYEYGSFLGSRMAGRGVTCLDCHNPHSMRTLLPGNFLCLRCHAGGNPNAPVINPVTHSHHKVFGFDAAGRSRNIDLKSYDPDKIQERGGECVNCHMPQTVYMERHWRHDHGFTLPDPLLTKQFGIPNACNRCHADKDADWALAFCQQWYGTNMDRVTRRRARVVAAAQQGEPGSKAGLMEILGKEDSPYWRAVAGGLLDTWATQPEVSAALVRGLQDTNALVRAACARALEPAARAGFGGVVEALTKGLADPRRSVRVAAAEILAAGLDPASQAARDFKGFLANNADQPSGQLEAGVYAFARNDFPEALGHLRKAVAWDPSSGPMRQELAVVLSAMNRPQEAVDALEAACRLAPNDPDAHYKLALAWNEAGDLNRTVAELKLAVGLDPHYARAWYNLGLAQSALDRPEQALDSLARAETADSEDPRIPYARATLLARLGRRREAATEAQRALDLRPGFVRARELLRALRQN